MSSSEPAAAYFLGKGEAMSVPDSFDACFKEGYKEGYLSGHNTGFEEGYDKAYSLAYSAGYEAGYKACQTVNGKGEENE